MATNDKPVIVSDCVMRHKTIQWYLGLITVGLSLCGSIACYAYNKASDLTTEQAVQSLDISNCKTDIKDLKTDIKEIKTDIGVIKTTLGSINGKLDAKYGSLPGAPQAITTFSK